MALNVDKTALTSSADSTLYDQTIKMKGEDNDDETVHSSLALNCRR